ncbi:MAG: Neutral/alkaline non-lysosomal ceramidase [Gemmataceae bacterium]|nr:Neutral/alkaline non-lysosomal ceramidase [Gemmataceae bacterium]
MPTPPPTRTPAGWPFALACLVAALCVDLSGFHERHHGDSLVPVMVSLYKWEPFYWGQNRFGMPVPLLATPFTHPFTNLLVQNGLNIFGGLAALGLLARFLLRDPIWAGVGAAGIVLFLVSFPDNERFEVLNGSQPYLAPLALALAGTLLAVGTGPRPITRRAAGVLLTLLAYWYNAGLGMMTAPLVAGRFLAALRVESAPPPAASSGGPVRRAWADPRVRELAGGIALIGLGTVAGLLLTKLSPDNDTNYGFVPPGEWVGAWAALADNTLDGFGGYLAAVAGVAAAGLIWLVIPSTRAAAVRCWAAFGVVAAGLVALFLLVGPTAWVKFSGHSSRYLFGGLAALAPGAAAVLVGPGLAVGPAVARRAGWAALIVLPAVAVGVYGPPSATAARAAVDRATGRWTDDLLATGCTHVGGDYWAVWPATFHANMTLADRGEKRVIWGVTHRSLSTYHLWSKVPPERVRLGVLNPARPDYQADTLWQWAYPDAAPVETRPTLTVYVSRGPPPPGRPARADRDAPSPRPGVPTAWFPAAAGRVTIRRHSPTRPRCPVRHAPLALLLVAVLTSGSLVSPARTFAGREATASAPLRVGAAAVELVADDDMVIGGSILPFKVTGQDGKLRAVAVVVEKPGSGKLVIVACDVLMLNRDLLDPAVEEIATALGVPAAHVLINCTHTHHAPSTCTVHGYPRDELFCRRVQKAIVKAARDADAKLKDGGATFHFRLGEESSIGQNSRLLLKDDTIFWIGPRDDAVRPTGPFDPELPVLAFRGPDGKPRATIFNHSTHTIGVRKPGRSPSFYGLAAQELEDEIGGVVSFLEGASGSTHNLGVPAAEATVRMKQAVKDALGKAAPRPVDRVAGLKKPFTFKVRTFDEAKEDAAVSAYCKKRAAKAADDYIEAFRKQRAVLAPKQGEERTTWVQAVLIGDVAIVGVPAEFFTVLGQDIKRRSPFRYTYVAELANDWIGYLPDRKGHELGGYQTWTGLHSYAEPGTGERVVDETVKLLDELAKGKK